MESDPHEMIVWYVNNSFVFPENLNLICHRIDDQYYDYKIDELGLIYHPGQTFTLSLTGGARSAIIMPVDDYPNRACKSHSIKDKILLEPNVCTKVDYNILHSENNCEIYLQGTIMTSSLSQSIEIKSNWQFIDAYRIRISHCPLGFALNIPLLVCQCDPNLKTIVISVDKYSCNTDNQTILCPASSWIIGTTNTQHLHAYQVSSQCSFDYCLPHSSHLNLFLILILSVSLIGLVCCVEGVKKVSVLCLALLSVNIVLITIYFFSYFLP